MCYGLLALLAAARIEWSQWWLWWVGSIATRGGHTHEFVLEQLHRFVEQRFKISRSTWPFLAVTCQNFVQFGIAHACQLFYQANCLEIAFWLLLESAPVSVLRKGYFLFVGL